MTASAPTPAQAVRLAPEHRFADELARLAAADTHARPPGWRLSPRAVRQFILGDAGLKVSQKFFGDDALVDRAIVTLMGHQGLMLVGERLIASGINSPLRSKYSTRIFLQALPRPLAALPNWLNAQVSQTPPGSP